MNWGLVVRRTAMTVGATFVVSAIVYLVARLVVWAF
jgi:hypothetical protein